MRQSELRRIVKQVVQEHLRSKRARLQSRIAEATEYNKTEILAFIDDRLKKYTQSKELERRILDKIIAALTDYHRNLFQKKNNWIKDIK
jgi:hypothetical protein